MVRLTKAPIRVQNYINRKAPSCGASAMFIGQVRNRNLGRKVKAIQYTAYGKMAKKQLERIVKDGRKKYDADNIIIVHRTGLLRVGEVSMVVAVYSAHRKEAFDALRYCVEAIKKKVPIFKKEIHMGG